ncbi:MAG TPA: alkaline phosphatase family protein [Bryobacteraceae bacterium]|nr:alkaline phosphatase family protein [Bryobacteraceae bacterium]
MKTRFPICSLFLLPALYAQSTTTPIQHVVVIFQENVSFDHYFATYPNALNKTAGEPSFNASTNTPSVNGLAGSLMTNNPNSAKPFRLTRAQAVTCDQGHGYTQEQQAFNSGLMDKFVESVGGSSASCDIGVGKAVVMGYYDGNTVTAFWNYAQNFAMSDNSFNTQFGPSTPGALNLISGQTHGATLVSGSAAGNVSSGSVIGDPRPALALDDCTIKTAAQITMGGKNVGDLLNAKNVTWGWFQGGFRPSAVNPDGSAVCATAHNNISGASAGTDYIPHHQPFQYYKNTANPHHLPPSTVAMIGQTDQANHQYDLIDFFAAVNNGNLPAVSYLKAAAYQDGHAGYSDPLDEQTFVVNTINAIMSSPAWSTTAIIIAYDDSDGWYDHVVGPIVSPSGVADDNLAGAGSCGNSANSVYQGRCGYGPRLPLLVISPYAKVNFVDHTTTDQSSILRFVEDNWSLGRIGDNSMDAVAGPLNNMFNFSTASASAVILDPATGLVTAKRTPVAVTKALANPETVATSAATLQLDGSLSSSFNGQPLSYQWSLGPTSLGASILNGTSAKATVQFTSGPGTYVFLLTVFDSTGASSTDTTTVTYTGK